MANWLLYTDDLVWGTLAPDPLLWAHSGNSSLNFRSSTTAAGQTRLNRSVTPPLALAGFLLKAIHEAMQENFRGSQPVDIEELPVGDDAEGDMPEEERGRLSDRVGRLA